MDDTQTKKIYAVFCLVLLGGIVVTTWLSVTVTTESWQSQAVRNSAAEWVVVDDRGRTEFRWMTVQPRREAGVLYLGENESLHETVFSDEDERGDDWTIQTGDSSLVVELPPARVVSGDSSDVVCAPITVSSVDWFGSGSAPNAFVAEPGDKAFELWDVLASDTVVLHQPDGSVDTVYRPGTWYGIDPTYVYEVGEFYLVEGGGEPRRVELWCDRTRIVVDGREWVFN